MSQTKTAAFFDLDRTLIDVNSATLYARYERKHGRMSLLQVLRTIGYTVLYHLNIGSIEKAYGKALQHFRGKREQELKQWTRLFFEEQVLPRMQPGAWAVLQEHKRQGHPLVMLTSSTCYQAELAAKAWGFDHWIANTFHVEAGLLVGTYYEPLCFGAGKVFHARAWADQTGIDLSQSYFYTDSYSDLPMLEAVGYPIIVNPDPKLRVLAVKRRWTLMDWKQKTQPRPKAQEA